MQDAAIQHQATPCDADATQGNHGLVDGALTQRIVGIFYDVYNELGPGFLETFTKTRFASHFGRQGWMSRNNHR